MEPMESPNFLEHAELLDENTPHYLNAFHKYLIALCQEALEWLSAKGQVSGFLFVNRRGNQITARGISSQLKTLAIRCNIPPETVYPHSFRHRFAKNFLEKFNDISLLADLMGHESIETTRIYLTKSTQEQRELIDKIVTW